MADDAALPRLDVWYCCDMVLCNFDCAYCASGSPDTGGPRSRARMWQDEDSVERFHRILHWIANIPFSVGLRLQTIGEPFASDEFLAAAARMSRQKNVRFVELVTNGSLLTSRLPRMVAEDEADLAKISLWITYHHGEISAERLVENAVFARRMGAALVVNALLFPDTLEPIARLHQLCAENGLVTNIDLGQDFNDAYAGFPFIPLMQDEDILNSSALIENRTMAMISVIAAAAPKGLMCSAGHDYVFIGRRGDVYPCLGYLRYLPNTKLGSALDPDFVPRLRTQAYAPCGIEKGCTCKEDFLHLELAQPGPDRERSLGYWPSSAEQSVDPDVLARFGRVAPSSVLENAAFWRRHSRAHATPA
ncbi:MAG: radical SAM protein [Xanthobacteraceae bacterium]